MAKSTFPVIHDESSIQDKIYIIRDQKVMLDLHLAEIYEVETRVLNQSVKRNIDRFPADFMFKLTQEEWHQVSSSQFVMMKLPRNRTGKYLPPAFTEHGVTMLTSILKNPKARKMNIAIDVHKHSVPILPNCYQQITTQFSYSQFTTHYSLFIIHHSLFTIHHSLLTIHYSSLTSPVSRLPFLNLHIIFA